MRRAALLVPSFAALALVGACVFPPSFDGYSSGGPDAGGEAGADAGGDGGAESSTDANGDATDAPAALPVHGEPCTPAGECAAGLQCSSSYKGTKTALVAGLPTPICLGACDPSNDYCTLSTGIAGQCFATGDSVAGPICWRSCEPSSTTDPCPTGQQCMYYPDFPSAGLCIPRCHADADCASNPFGWKHCQKDGVCYPYSGPADPTALCTSTTPCSCYPTDGHGTCSIACEKDADCPKTSTGVQMVCPESGASAIPSFSFCALPCGSGGDCASVALTCSASVKAGTTPLCWD